MRINGKEVDGSTDDIINQLKGLHSSFSNFMSSQANLLRQDDSVNNQYKDAVTSYGNKNKDYAKSKFQEIIDAKKKSHNPNSITFGFAYKDLGMMLLEENKLDEAEKKFDEASSIFNKFDRYSHLSEQNYIKLAEFHKEKGSMDSFLQKS